MDALVLAIMAGTALLTATGPGGSSLNHLIEEIEQSTAHESPKGRIAAMLAAYHAYFPEVASQADCSTTASGQLKERFAATAHIARYVADERWLTRMRCLHPQMKDAFPEDETADRALQDLLIATRHFDEAHTLSKRISRRSRALPEIFDQQRQAPGLLVPTDAGRLQWKPWRPSRGWHVVAMVHPLCGFSRRALEAMTTKDEWSELRDHLQLVVQREPRWSGEPEVRAWNVKNPDLPMAFQANAVGWEELDSYETPVFHIMHNGEMISTIVGWRHEGEPLAAAWAQAQKRDDIALDAAPSY